MKPDYSKPYGEIVHVHEVEAHKFEVEKLATPYMRGAGLRFYRLWHNGGPNTGAQYFYTLEDAKEQIEYVLISDLKHKNKWLMWRVAQLEKELHMRGPEYANHCGAADLLVCVTAVHPEHDKEATTSLVEALMRVLDKDQRFSIMENYCPLCGQYKEENEEHYCL